MSGKESFAATARSVSLDGTARGAVPQGEIADLLSVPPHERRRQREDWQRERERERLADSLLRSSQRKTETETETEAEGEGERSEHARTAQAEEVAAAVAVNRQSQDKQREDKRGEGGEDEEDPHTHRLREGVARRLARDAVHQAIADETLTEIGRELAEEAPLLLRTGDLTDGDHSAHAYILEGSLWFRLVRDTLTLHAADAHMHIDAYLREKKRLGEKEISLFRGVWTETLASFAAFGRAHTQQSLAQSQSQTQTQTLTQTTVDPTKFAEEFMRILRKSIRGFASLAEWREALSRYERDLASLVEEEEKDTQEFNELRYKVDEKGRDLEEYPADVVPASVRLSVLTQRREQRVHALREAKVHVRRFLAQVRAMEKETYALPQSFSLRNSQYNRHTRTHKPSAAGRHFYPERNSSEESASAYVVRTREEEEEEFVRTETAMRFQDSCARFRVVWDRKQSSSSTSSSGLSSSGKGSSKIKSSDKSDKVTDTNKTDNATTSSGTGSGGTLSALEIVLSHSNPHAHVYLPLPIWRQRLPLHAHRYRRGSLSVLSHLPLATVASLSVSAAKDARVQNAAALAAAAEHTVISNKTAPAMPLFCSSQRVLGIEIDQAHAHGQEMDAWETFSFLLDLTWTREFNVFPRPIDNLIDESEYGLERERERQKENESFEEKVIFVFECPEDAQPLRNLLSADLALLLRKFPAVLRLWCTQLALASIAVDACPGKLFSPFHYTHNVCVTSEGMLLLHDICLLDVDEDEIYSNHPSQTFLKRDVFQRRKGESDLYEEAFSDVRNSDQRTNESDTVMGSDSLHVMEYKEALHAEKEALAREAAERELLCVRGEWDSEDEEALDTLNDCLRDPFVFDLEDTGYRNIGYDYVDRFVRVQSDADTEEIERLSATLKECKMSFSPIDAHSLTPQNILASHDSQTPSTVPSAAPLSLEQRTQRYMEAKALLEKKFSVNERFRTRALDTQFSFNFANFVPWIYDILQAATASSRREFLRLKTVSSFQRLGYPLRFPQYAFDKKKNASVTTSAPKSRKELLQAWAEEEPVALSPTQTFVLVQGCELQLELYCGEINHVRVHDFEDVYARRDERDILGEEEDEHAQKDTHSDAQTGKVDLAKVLFNGQFDPESDYHELNIVKRVIDKGTYKVDPNAPWAKKYREDQGKKPQGPQIHMKINRRNATANLQSRVPAEPPVARIFNKNNFGVLPSRDVNNPKREPHKYYNALLSVTSDTPCVLLLEFSVFICNDMDVPNSWRKSGAVQIQIVPDVPPASPEVSEVLVCLEQFHRSHTQVPTTIFRAQPFVAAPEVWRDEAQSREVISDAAVAWGRIKRRLQQHDPQT